MTVTRPIYS